MLGYQVRHVYHNTALGKNQAIRNLQFALEDNKPWYLSCAWKHQNRAAGTFNQWVLRDTFDDACHAIRFASHEIKFFQINATEVEDDFKLPFMH